MNVPTCFPTRLARLRNCSMAAVALLLAPLVCLAARPVPAKPAAPTGPQPKDANPHIWNPQTKCVAVFKNGYGFFMREGAVTVRDGWCAAKQVPPAAFGTLAIYAHDEGAAVDVVGSGPGEIVDFDDRDTAADAGAKRTRLEASKGMKVSLQYQHKGQERTAAGKLVSVGPEFAVLEDEASSFAVPVEGITRLQVLDLPLRIHVTGDQDKPVGKPMLGMAYLRKGISWIPDYTLKILDDDNAELTLRGTLINEAEDLIHTDVHLVVGVPHFVHTEYMAPLAVGQVIRSIGSSISLGNGAPPQVMTQMMNRAAIVSNNRMAPLEGQEGVVTRPVDAEGGNLAAATGNLPQMEGAAATDYTVYTKRDLTLRMGEKAIVTLFTQKIRYSHIYRWSIPGEMQHSLVLNNATATAWTTGPCLALSGNSPLSEDLLQYVPKGGHGELAVTTAINVAHEKTERETDRKLKAHSPSHEVYFDLVTLEGKLRLRNFEKRMVELVVTDRVPGKPISAEAGGVLAADPAKLRLLDREGDIRWKLKLEPGEEKTVGYQYERYVPSN